MNEEAKQFRKKYDARSTSNNIKFDPDAEAKKIEKEQFKNFATMVKRNCKRKPCAL